jgi:hypothetical protein
VRTKESVSCGGTEAKRWNCRRRCPNGRVVARVEKRYRESIAEWEAARYGDSAESEGKERRGWLGMLR